jgi:type II secretory pathway pseudopilin PulG
MRQDGYTLAEALAAMLILGLAIGGLVEGSRAIGRLQSRVNITVNETREVRRAEAALTALLRDRAGDDRSFKGDPTTFSFNCSAGVCGLATQKEGKRPVLVVRRGEVAQRFLLPPASNFRLVYAARDGRFDRWPPEGSPRALRGVQVVATSAQGELPVVMARSWVEHPKTCEFDMIARGCRTSAP